VQVAGCDLEAFGELAAAPVAVGLGGHEGGDALSPGGRLGAGPGWVLAVGAGPGLASGRAGGGVVTVTQIAVIEVTVRGRPSGRAR
jgi:hypothetical protein